MRSSLSNGSLRLEAGSITTGLPALVMAVTCESTILLPGYADSGPPQVTVSPSLMLVSIIGGSRVAGSTVCKRVSVPPLVRTVNPPPSRVLPTERPTCRLPSGSRQRTMSSGGAAGAAAVDGGVGGAEGGGAAAA